MDFLFDYDDKKQIKEYEKILEEIYRHSKSIKVLSDEDLKHKTDEFKGRIAKGEELDDILPEVFAVVREASRRYLGIEQYPVQLMGAIALHRGDVAEMKTGEGKTYTAPLAAYLNALTGKTVHIATSNDALASRDGDLVTPLFEGLGLTVGVVTEERNEDYKADREGRKKAYSCDITYGSSNAFAFDYLRDNTTYNLDNFVRGDREIGFIIIDEADQILVNDAVMPFKLSGTVKSPDENILERMQRQMEEKRIQEEQARINSAANSFVYKLLKDSERTKEFKSEEQMFLRMGGNQEATNQANKNYTVLYTKSASAHLTERGWLEAFRYFEGAKIDKIISKKPELITKNSSFQEGKDYFIEDGYVSLSLRGLEKATKEIKEIKNLNNVFYSSGEFSVINKAIDNALKAYFVLEKGKEYILDDSKVEKGIAKKKVLLVSNGRTAEGRVYSDGLQQAIELKEQKLNQRAGIQIEKTSEHGEIASISQKSFYSIYPKIAGMTGTSAKDLFEEIYGMETISIPKNSEYKVSDEEIEEIYSGRIDKETVLFETEKEKLDAVINSVLESRKTGQPVLIGTTSVSESNKLYEAFKKMGIPCEKLNAEISDIVKENDIISRAGTRGSVTISTQMAGRGTDIKLGGNLEDFILQVEKEKVEQMVKNATIGKTVTEEEIRKLYIGATKFIEHKKKDETVQEAKKRLYIEQQELVKTGGLKVIGYGHCSTKRDDDQLRGRAARQADPGVTEFYCSVSNLKQELGVSNEKIKGLRKKGLAKGNPISGPEVEKVISTAQTNVEGIITSVIASTQESDYHLSRMRKKVYDQRMRMLKGESPKEHMEFIIDCSVVNLIASNLPEGIEISPRKKVKRSGLNINNLIIDAEETLGIDLTKKFEDGEFERLADLEKYLSVEANKKYDEIRKYNGEEKQDKLDRNAIIGILDNAWLDFNGSLEHIKNQHRLHSLAQNKDYDEIFAMKKGFNEAMIISRAQAISKMLGKPSRKTREIPKEEEKEEIDESLNDYYVEETRKSNTSNLSVRAAKLMTTLSNKIKLISGKIKYQFELVPIYGDEKDIVENIDFDGNTKQNYTSHSQIPVPIEESSTKAK